MCSREEILSHLEKKGVRVGPRTLKRDLRELGITAYKVSKAPLIPANAVKKRLEFAKLHLHTDIKQWIFTDEVPFTLFPQRAEYIYTQTIPDPNIHFVPRVHSQGGRLHAWGCVGVGYKGSLLFVRETGGKDTFDSDSFEKIIKAALPSIRKTKKKIFQNSPIHNSKQNKNFFSQIKLSPPAWPPYSPDLNPIENLWSILKDKIYIPGDRPATFEELERCAKLEWAHFDQGLIDHVVFSFKDRLQACINQKGMHTGY